MPTLIETKLKQERLLRIIEDELQDLPPLPAVIMRVMETVSDPATSAADLNRLISADQALASKVLRLVNSSYYGFPRKIATITNAVVILGFNTVRNLTTSLGAFKAFDAQGQKTALALRFSQTRASVTSSSRARHRDPLPQLHFTAAGMSRACGS